MPYPGLLMRGSRGGAVKQVQRKVRVTADGDFGPVTEKAVRKFQDKHDLVADGQVGPHTHAALFGGAPKKRVPLRERAYRVAALQVGVVESGGNNQGVPFVRYQKPNGAVGPEPWCGDFVAFCYRQAGSKMVTRAWAAVRLISVVAGNRAITKPRRGDIVRFKFDHVGLFVRWCPDHGIGAFETIEGNTGTFGAVSDSSTGGDGVYRKIRYSSQVSDFRRVLR